MPDIFDNTTPGLESPASDGFAITPNDGADLAVFTRSIYVGGAGNISLVTVKGTTLSFVGLPAGAILPIRAARIRSTGTTATSLVGLV
jgi:hypothetical protein